MACKFSLIDIERLKGSQKVLKEQMDSMTQMIEYYEAKYPQCSDNDVMIDLRCNRDSIGDSIFWNDKVLKQLR